MRPILYAPNETDFAHNGLGVLHDCVTCYTEEERNGIYELSFAYPVDGIHYEDLGMRSLVKVKPNRYDDPQLFRVYSISKPLKGIVTVKAAHISYDLSGIIVSPFSAVGITDALQKLKSEAVTEYPFDFFTDFENETLNYNVRTPRSVRYCMGGAEGSLLDVFGGGEFQYDNYKIYLKTARGQDRGVTIKYGKNLTSLKQDESCSNLYTGIYPYWVDTQDNTVVELEQKVVSVEGEFDFDKVLPLDLSAEFENRPTEQQMIDYCERYIDDNNIGKPNVSLSVSFEQLDKYDGYENMKLLQQVQLCDTVTISYTKLGVNARAKVIKYKWDCLKEKPVTATIGMTKATMSDAIISTRHEIDAKPDISRIRSAAEAVTSQVLGASGGYVRLIDTNHDGELDTLYIADNPVPEDAVKVWRFNYEGWGASKNGFNGPFVMGATLDGGIVADFITAGTFDANLIRAGIIQAALNGFWLNLEDGTFNFGNNRISYDGTHLNIAADTITMSGQPVVTNETVQNVVDESTEELSDSISDLRSDFESFTNDFDGFITILPSEPSITLGRTNSNSNVKITDTTMTFTGSGNARAVLGDSKFSVQQIETDSLSFGNSAWERRSNGHISLKRVSN